MRTRNQRKRQFGVEALEGRIVMCANLGQAISGAQALIRESPLPLHANTFGQVLISPAARTHGPVFGAGISTLAQDIDQLENFEEFLPEGAENFIPC